MVMINMMYDNWQPKNLEKEELFRDYVSRYEYKNVVKALGDFNDIYNILNVIGKVLQWHKFNNMGSKSIEEQAAYIYKFLAEANILTLNYPFKFGDRYYEFHPQQKGD